MARCRRIVVELCFGFHLYIRGQIGRDVDSIDVDRRARFVVVIDPADLEGCVRLVVASVSEPTGEVAAALIGFRWMKPGVVWTFMGLASKRVHDSFRSLKGSGAHTKCTLSLFMW
jgi:hypothetical protein